LGCHDEAKIFNPNADKLDSKTVSCYFIGCSEKSNCFLFYCPDRHTKFKETRHAVFLEDAIMRGSTVPQEISLEEKWIYVPTPIIHELIPLAPAHEPIIPTCMVESSSVAPNVHETHVIHEHEVPIAANEEDQPHTVENDVPNQENLRRSQRVRKSVIPDNYEIYTSEKIHMEGDPASYEESM
jgi:hypothetical protein